VPVLDNDGREIELSSVTVPQEIEADSVEAIESHVLDQLTAPSGSIGVQPNPASNAAAVIEVAENAPTDAEGGE
jgi:hypothetical protein